MKKITTMAVAIAVVLTLSACAGTAEAPQSSSADERVLQDAPAGKSGGWRPDGQADEARRVMGRVTAINGNELELELVEMDRGEMPPPEANSGEIGAESNAESGAETGQRPQRPSGAAPKEGTDSQGAKAKTAEALQAARKAGLPAAVISGAALAGMASRWSIKQQAKHWPLLCPSARRFLLWAGKAVQRLPSAALQKTM